MLCKGESRDPEHCLKEGRKVTRCAQDLITKVRTTCLKEFDAHWECLERNNQVRPSRPSFLACCDLQLTIDLLVAPLGILSLSQARNRLQQLHL